MNTRFNRKNYTEFKEKAILLKFKNPKFFNFIEKVGKSHLNSKKYEVFRKGTQVVILNNDLSKENINSSSHINLYRNTDVSNLIVGSSMKSKRLYMKDETFVELLNLLKGSLYSSILSKRQKVKLDKSMIKFINKLYKMNILVATNNETSYISDDNFEVLAFMFKDKLRIVMTNLDKGTILNTTIRDVEKVSEFIKIFPDIQIGNIK
jgi:hypothetical protein